MTHLQFYHFLEAWNNRPCDPIHNLSDSGSRQGSEKATLWMIFFFIYSFVSSNNFLKFKGEKSVFYGIAKTVKSKFLSFLHPAPPQSKYRNTNNLILAN